MHDDEKEEEGRFRRRRGTPVRRGFWSRIGVWLLGAIIMGIVPLAVSLWARSLVADYVPMLKQATAAAAAGSAAVVAVSFSLVLFLEFYAYWKLGPSAGGADGAPITGRLQFLIVYVLVPLVPGLAVGYLTLAPATRLSHAIDWIRQPSAVQVERQVGQAIQGAAGSETRVAGLRALAQFGSPDALNELARLATGSPQLLNDPSSFDALAAALASFGSQAEPVLHTIWKTAGHAGAESTTSEGKTPGDSGAGCVQPAGCSRRHEHGVCHRSRGGGRSVVEPRAKGSGDGRHRDVRHQERLRVARVVSGRPAGTHPTGRARRAATPRRAAEEAGSAACDQ